MDYNEQMTTKLNKAHTKTSPYVLPPLDSQRNLMFLSNDGMRNEFTIVFKIYFTENNNRVLIYIKIMISNSTRYAYVLWW
jgi:hypothetical protein